MAAQRQITRCGFILAASVDGNPCWAFQTPFSVFNASADNSGWDLQRMARYYYGDESPAFEDHRGRYKGLFQADYPSRTSHVENGSVTPCRCPDSRKGVPVHGHLKTLQRQRQNFHYWIVLVIPLSQLDGNYNRLVLLSSDSRSHSHSRELLKPQQPSFTNNAVVPTMMQMRLPKLCHYQRCQR